MLWFEVFPFNIAVRDIEKFPGSSFECMIKKEWMSEQKPIMIERDGSLFKYVNAFLVTDCIPRDNHGVIALCKDALLGLQEEADFYGLDVRVRTVQNLSKEDLLRHRGLSDHQKIPAQGELGGLRQVGDRLCLRSRSSAERSVVTVLRFRKASKVPSLQQELAFQHNYSRFRSVRTESCCNLSSKFSNS